MKRKFFLEKTGKKFLGFILAATIAVTGVPFPASQVEAADGDIAVSGTGSVTSETTRTVSIGNDSLSRTFEIVGGKLKTGTITNDLGKSDYTPAEGSEEFVIRTIGKAGSRVEAPENTLTSLRDKEEWNLEVDSNQSNEGGGADALLDGDLSSYYHSQYTPSIKFPVKFTLDRGDSISAFQTLGYVGRSQGANTNGNISTFKMYAADSESDLFNEANLVTFSDGTTLGKIDMTDAYPAGQAQKWIYVSLQQPCEKRYVGIQVVESQNGGSYAAGAELDLFEGKFDSVQGAVPGTEIKASDLKLNAVTAEAHVTEGGKEGNEGKKEGQLLTFTFDPVPWGNTEGSEVTIEQKVVMYEGDHYMRKWIEIDFSKATDKEVRIAYIDGEHLYTKPSTDDLNEYRPKNEDKEKDIIWTIPANSGGIVQMKEALADLGQPVYINGMFMGSEFPAAQNKIEMANATDTTEQGKRLAIARYYTGKNLTDFERDDHFLNQLTTDHKYVSWQTVMGASRSDGSNQSVVQQDFYSYIRDISTPSEFRIQYNSWYDNMMRINDDNIMQAFKDIDKNFVNTGVRPLDSYVVDDGWNLYRQTAGSLNSKLDIERNGPVEDYNTEGFWAFNSKFPYELTTSSTFVQNMGSYFGVWIGPRGGYNYYGTLANLIQQGIDVDTDNDGITDTHVQYGSKAGGSIDVADSRYIKKYAEMTVDWTRRFKVNYWKWDGFADIAQYDAFSKGNIDKVGYSETNQHMFGGPNGEYHASDLWEKWIYIMETTREAAEAEGITNLWISLTCYTNPSPWFLQWANSVWLQCTHDRGEISNSVLNDKMNNMLTYRDATYYSFIVDHEFQFPLSNIYNHDPIYGKEDTGINAGSMNGEQFRNNLFMQSGRGTAFWELYYSDSIFNQEKYLINADYLAWAEEHYELLKHSIMIGGTPNSGTSLAGIGSRANQYAYGFAGFSETEPEGIISMRNPSNENLTLEFTLDESIGVRFDVDYTMWKEHTYLHSAGQTLATHLVDGKEAEGNLLHKDERISITLKPGETQIWHLKEGGEKEAPVLDKLYFNSANKIQVRASERLYNENIAFEVNGKIVDASKVEKMADLRTFIITLEEDMKDGDMITVTPSQATDRAGNNLTESITSIYYEDNEVVFVSRLLNTEGVLSGEGRSIEGGQGFAVSAEVVYHQSDVVLVDQDGEYSLGIDKEGYPYFEVDGVRAAAKYKMQEGKTYTISGVRENNNQVRIYLNGQISNANNEAVKEGYEVQKAPITYAKGENIVRALTVYSAALSYDQVTPSALEILIEEVEASKEQYTPESWEAAKVEEALADAKEAIAYSNEDDKTAAYDKLMTAYGKLIPPATVRKNYAAGKTPTRGWVNGDSYDSNYQNSRNSHATDGNKSNADNYTIVGKDNAGTDGKAKPSYMQIDLGQKIKIDEIKLWRYWNQGRQYDATALTVSDDPDFKEQKVLYYSHESVTEENASASNNDTASGNDVFGLGIQPTDKLYAESSEGKTLYNSEEEEEIEARYVRLYVTGHSKGNSEVHICEFEVYGLEAVSSSLEEVQEAIDKAKAAIASDQYTEESTAELQDVITEAEAFVSAGADVSQGIGAVKEMAAKLENAIRNLVLKVTVTFDVNGGTGNYATQVIPSGTTVNEPETEPEKEGEDFLGWYLGSSRYDFNSIVTKDITLTARFGQIDKTKLAQLITEAESLKAEDFTPESWEVLLEEIEAAKEVNQKADALQKEIDEAESALRAAIRKLEEVVKQEEENPENPPIDPENPPVDPEDPPVDPEDPSVEPEKPPVDPEDPSQDEKDDTNYGEILPRDRNLVKGNIPDGIWAAGLSDGEYTGQKVTPQFRLYDGNKLLQEKVDYTVSYKNNVKGFTWEGEEPGTGVDLKKAPQAVIKMKGNYSGTITEYFRIEPVSLTDEAVVAADTAIAANGKKVTLKPQITWNGKKLSSKDYSIKGAEKIGTQPGIYPITLVGQGNYQGEREINVIVAAKDQAVPIDKVSVKYNKKVPWTGETISPSENNAAYPLTVSYKGKALKEGQDYKISYANNKAAGVASIILEGLENTAGGTSFVGDKVINFTITGKSMSKVQALNIDKAGYPYTEKEIEILSLTKEEGGGQVKINYKPESKDLEAGKEFTVSYEKNIHKGTAVMILTGNPEEGFTGTKKITFKIAGDEIKKDKYTILLVEDKVQNDVENNTTSDNNVSGNTASGNTVSGNTVNTGEKISYSELAKDDKGVYVIPYTQGGTKPSVAIFDVSGNELEEGRDFVISYKNNKKIGTGSVVIKGKGNYAGVENVEFKIEKNKTEENTGVVISVKDKEESTKKNGWKQNFKVVDGSGKSLTAKDVKTKEAKYYVQSIPSGKDQSLVGKEITNDAAAQIPVGSVIRIEITLNSNNYEGTVNGTYRIIKKGYDISKATIKLNQQFYTGKEIEIDDIKDIQTAEIKLDGQKKSLVFGEHFVVVEGSYDKNIKKGTAKVTLKAAEDNEPGFGGSKTVTFKIAPQDVKDTWKGSF